MQTSAARQSDERSVTIELTGNATIADLKEAEEEAALELSVVMPCLNEAETLGSCIQKAHHAIRELQIAGEVVVADNGSTDGSLDIAHQLGARVVPVQTPGYGSALIGGISAAQGRYVIFGDADDSYDFTDLAPFLLKLREGYDLVMGNRFLGEYRAGAMPPLHRYFGTPALTGLGRLFFRSPVGDYNCGMRGLDKTSISKLDLRSPGMEFASEMVVKASLHRLRIAEVPTTLSPAGRSRPPHLRTWSDGWRHLRFLLLHCPRWLFLYPGALLMLVGMALSLWLLPGERTINGVGLGVPALTAASVLIVVGHQALMFSYLAKTFAIREGVLPADERVTWVSERISLEAGLRVGVLLAVTGVFGLSYAIYRWNVLPMSFPQLARVVVPSVTFLALGAQTVLYSFFLSILELRRP
jgi:hypothetical protein